MGGAADLPQRSSSPLKRRASSMDPEQENYEAKEDVEMVAPPDSPEQQLQSAGQDGDKQTATTAADVQTETNETTELPLRTGKHDGTPQQGDSVLTGMADLPPLEHQIKTIQTLLKAFAETPPQEGDEVFLVSRQWLNRAQAFGGDARHAGKDKAVGELGPVDNSDIISSIFTDAIGQHCVKLKPGMSTENFEMFPKDAWDLIVSWYGLAQGQAPIRRFAHNTAPDAVSLPNIQFEFHPPVFIIHRLWSANSPIPLEQELKQKAPAPPVIVQSTSSGFHNFLKQAKQLTGVAPDRKVRLWRRLQMISASETPAVATGINTPPDSPDKLDSSSDILFGPPTSTGAWSEMLVDVESFLKLEKDVERGLVDAEDTTVNPKYNGSKTLALVGLTVDHTLILDEQVDKTFFVTTYVPSATKDNSLASKGASANLSAQTRVTASGRNSPALSGPMTRGRAQQKPGRTIGSVGLQNLGNTCYMNSALQCVRSVEELTKYFLTHEAQKEINTENPLSYKGEVAMAYSRLLEELYKESVPNSIAPRHFKNVIGRHAPSFSGYGQQDSQEFLGFLLDGLQEDLNRIKKKPYIEKPDSTDEMVNNPELIRKMANEVWDITKKRDDSVISDLFTGMYKSTLVCPVCDKVSITFDPFNNLTLPLPVASFWHQTVKFVPLNDAPVNIAVELDKNGTIKSLKEYISARVGVPVNRLFGAEEFRDKFFKYYDDSAGAAEEIQKGDFPTIHELEAPPTNFVGIKKTKNQNNRRGQESNALSWEEGMADRLLVPVFHRLNPEDPNVVRLNMKGQKIDHKLPPPHFIVLTPEEAMDEEVIRRKVLEKVASFTTWREFLSADETDTAETTDPEMVNTTSDVDSADSKVLANSVSGDEDIVDVSMRDSTSNPKLVNGAPAEESPMWANRFNRRRPKWVNPKEYLDGQFQNLFDMSFFHENSSTAGPVPIGWNVVNDDNPFPKLRSRKPSPPPSDIEMQSPGTWPGGSEESGSEEAQAADAALLTRMADESSEEDSDFPKVKNMAVAPRPNGVHAKNNVSAARGKNKKMKSFKTYGKKGRKRFDKQQRAAQSQQQQHHLQQNRSYDIPQPDGEPDGGPLVRLGEGLVIDWFQNVFDEVFGAIRNHHEDGFRTYVSLEHLEDPAIERGKKLRALRAKNGIKLEDCLNEFEKTEILSEQDTWFCPRCKEHRRASKKFDLWRTPDILVVHLKRFSSSGYRRDKLDILVDFPIEGLDLTKRVINKEDGKQEIYDLIAVDDHWGGLGGGHYTAFAKNFFDDEWYEYNDSSVSKTKDPAKIVTSAAYLLFYRRRSEVPLGGPRFQEIFERFERARPTADDDTRSGSGEDQRLGQGSSPRGSPSASTGAGLIRPLGSRGLASSTGPAASGSAGLLLPATAADDDEVDMLPTYQESTSGQDGGVIDGGNGMTGLVWANETLRNSIEADGEDEGIGMEDYDGPDPRNITGAIFQPGWTFANVGNTGAGSVIDDDDDGASNIAEQDDSSNNEDYPSDQEMGTGMMVMSHGPMARLAEEPGSGYLDPEEPQPPLVDELDDDDEFQGFESPPGMREPSLDEQAFDGQVQYTGNRVLTAEALSHLDAQQVHNVPVLGNDEDGASDKVAEIHVEEEDHPSRLEKGQ